MRPRRKGRSRSGRTIDVAYRLRPISEGAELEAEDLGGRILAQATGALLTAGALDVAVGRIGDAVAA